jgi:Ca2+-binding EF-hand superfamily protein
MARSARRSLIAHQEHPSKSSIRTAVENLISQLLNAMKNDYQTDLDDFIDGMLTFQEFAAGFDMFDTNGNGFISQDEMNAALA